MCCQEQVDEAQKQVSKLTAELAEAKKAFKKLESDSSLTSKKSSKALEELKQHLVAAEKYAAESRSALGEVSIPRLRPDTVKLKNLHNTRG